MAIDLPTSEQWNRWGIDPGWHRVVQFDLPDGSRCEWSILDTGEGARGTIVCVHGNPTWGYLWRGFLQELRPDWRVIAIDQTGMGWSQRSNGRTLDERVTDLVSFCEQYVRGPVVLAAHDWGGPVALGAAASLDVDAVILGNTGVGLPARTSVPPLIATARRFVDLTCRRSSLFVDGTAMMAAKEHRNALRAPYRSADRRVAVADFVADIPLSSKDRSWGALQRSAATLERLEVPLLLVWGGSDPVFHDRFLADLVARAPHAVIHRFPDAGHLVPLDEPMAEVAGAWLDEVLPAERSGLAASPAPSSVDVVVPFVSITDSLEKRASDASVAFADPSGELSWTALAQRAGDVARVLVAAGMEPGDRVALLVPPGPELLSAAYGVWMAGGSLVVADTGLGFRGMRRVLRGAGLRWVFGTPATLLVAKALRFAPGSRLLCTGRFPSAVSVSAHACANAGPIELPRLLAEHEAAIVHTSGSTGPAKPVRYRHGALAAQRDVIGEEFGMFESRGFITSFAPFILLGPALGVRCVLPEGNVMKPAELDFERFAAAVARSGVDVAWLSPASARRIVETANGRTVPMRLVMLAGAPIAANLARSIEAVTGADVRAPWGMTEAMPLTDGVGACREAEVGTVTGAPLSGVDVRVVGLEAGSSEIATEQPWGELVIHSPWMFDGYEQQWSSNHSSQLAIDGRRFHRTGDLGFIDDDGMVRQLGRIQHVLFLASGAIPCAMVEDPVSTSLERQVVAVGVGPSGAQVIAVVVGGTGGLRLADAAMTHRVRSASTFAVAAVLEGELPVDIRHQSKIKRDVVAGDVAALLAGR